MFRKLIISLCLFPVLCFAAPRKATPPIKVPIVAAEPEISLEDLRLTIEHIQKLAREQQAELEKAKQENQSIEKELQNATAAHLEAQTDADRLQVQVNAVTDDRNSQAAEKDRALDQIDVFKVKIDKLVKHINQLKTWLAGEAAMICLFLLLWLGIPRLIPVYGWAITAIAPGIVFGLVWFLI